jgi:hypothetical protein
MKSKIIIFSILFFSLWQSKFAHAQTYGNEWINYNQTYFKFKIAKDSVYRINMSTLFAMGMPTTVAGANLQLFRDGIEQPIFVNNAGTLVGSDYLEFYGRRADGILDTALYKTPSAQLNPNMNLISDTAFYFVTFNTTTNNKRFELNANTIVNPPIKEAFFWHKIAASYRNAFVGGPSYFGATQTPVLYLNSSQYEDGEGFSRTLTTANDSITITCASPYNIQGGPTGYFKSTVVGSSYLTQHRLKIFANNNEIADSSFSSFGYKRFNVSVPLSNLSPANRIIFKYTPMNNGINNLPDRYGISYFEFRYPRLFDFANSSGFYFELDPKLSNFYLEITNFNTGNTSPRLYDLTSEKYYVGDISEAGKVKFLLPASAQIQKFYLQSLGAVNYGVVTDLNQVSFVNYSISANQGDYIILSHQGYFNDGQGNNYVNDYKSFRSSTTGGGFVPTIAEVQSIYDEFGYGYSFNSQALKNFLHYAVKSANWQLKPRHVLIIGKGVPYNKYLQYVAAPFSTYPFYAVPSFGEPASDILLSDFDKTSRPQLSIGRIPAMNGSDIKSYLDKIKDHEIVNATTSNMISDSVLWRKRILHIAGAKDAAEQAPILASLNKQANIIGSPFYGGNVTTIKKGTTSTVEDVNSKTIDNLFNSGLGLIQFFGHSSASGIDYNLDFPENYKNYKRYPVFIANGCGAGNIFILSGLRSLGERFVLTPNGGAISFIASVNTGLTSSLATYTDSLYGNIGFKQYGNTLGEQMQKTVFNFMSNPSFMGDNLLRLHGEQIVLNGDPATKAYVFEKPDYAVEEKGVTFKQLNLTTSIDSFDVEILVHNLGRYTQDSVGIYIKRVLPNNIENILFNQRYAGISNSDTIRLKVPVLGEDALGVNFLEVIIDQEGFIDEIAENNNSVKRQFVVYNDDLVPVYPPQFSIVSSQGITLKGSTLNAFAPSKTYVLQMDTTEAFDSPLLLSTSITSSGGVIKWQPTTTLRDSTVYYWRSAMDTLYGNKTHRWSTSSFVFLNQSAPGWNQSHYYQFLKNNYNSIYLDSASRQFKFSALSKKLQVQNVCMNAPAPYTYTWPDYLAKINGSTLYTFGCDPYPGYSSLQFIVIDTLTGQPWINTKDPNINQGRFGSFAPCRISPGGGVYEDPFFEFSFIATSSPVTLSAIQWRQRIMDFIDSIPTGYYMMIQPRLCVGAGANACGTRNTTFINQWKADTTTNGAGNSLYHKFKNLGFTEIDSFYKNRPMIFWSRKGRANTVQQFVESDSTKKLFAEFDFQSYLYEGKIASDKIGPAKVWSHFYRKGQNIDASSGDSVLVDIIGIDAQGNESVLASVQGDTSLSFIDAKLFPKLKLSMLNKDNIFSTPNQIKLWKVHFESVPEAALNPNRHFVFKDTLGQGQIQPISVAIENLTMIPMDSMLVKYDVIDANNNRSTIATKRYKQLPILDTILVNTDLSTGGYSGKNTFVIEANPNGDQLEQFHPNNIGYKEFYVVPDKKNPLIDVTFDGVHILDKDIVSAKPMISITLKDDNKYLALDDTSLVSVFMRYPDDNSSTENYIPYDGYILKFIPASVDQLSTKNLAKIEFRPTFTKDGKDYMLIVKAKDKTGNSAGSLAYKVGFEVINKPAISSVVNYPNPFTTSTQFVFTITGSEIPSNMKIQIMTPTGKIVKEILKSELGDLHIGRNITEYKWKGDDQYGQMLGNGVYLYRVVTNLNGSKMDHFESGADKWIEKGFGKLYIMR